MIIYRLASSESDAHSEPGGASYAVFCMSCPGTGGVLVGSIRDVSEAGSLVAGHAAGVHPDGGVTA